MDWERLGMAWAGATEEDVRKASEKVTRECEDRLERLRRQQQARRAAENDPGETVRERLERYRRYE